MSYHQTRNRRRWPRRAGMGALELPPMPEVPVPPAPEPDSGSGKSFFEELTDPIIKVFGTPPPPKPPAVVTPVVPLPARPGMSTTTKLLIAGGAVALVALITRR